MSSGRRHRKLSEEDAVLWRRVGKTVTPLRDRPLSLPTISQEEAEREFAAAMQEGNPRPAKKAGVAGDIKSPIAHHPLPPAPKRKPQPEPVIDRPTTRKIAKGRIAIDARVDLHAMTQDQAHDRLYVFLADQRARGARHVLVVTGKGRSLGSEGVLKRMVPVWLSSPRFAELVSGYVSASRHHGGEGAIYVRLRRLARADGSFRP